MRQVRQLRQDHQEPLIARPLDHRHKLGARAEKVAADYYETQGFQIEACNLRLGRLEIDLLARKGPLLVVVEVRARGPGSWQGPFASVRGAKLQRLRDAIVVLWRQRRGDPTLQRVRLDIAAVNLWVTPIEIEIAEAVL